MIRGRDIVPATDAVLVAATTGAALVVPLLYVPSLATPFTLPKEVAFQLAAAVCIAGWAVRVAVGGNGEVRVRSRAKPVVWTAALLLIVVAVSAAVAAATPPVKAPYAASVLIRWGATFGLACGAAVAGRSAAARAGLFQAATASAAVVSAVGLFQHFDIGALPIPVLSAPGSTFGNRNLGGEAVALSIPFGLAALALARLRWERMAVAAALVIELAYLAATRTRGAWIGGAAGIITVALLVRTAWSRAALLSVVIVAALATTIGLLPARWDARYTADSKRLAAGAEIVENSFDLDSTAWRTRFGLWRRSLAMFGTKPALGVGPGNWPVFFPQFAEPGATAAGVLGPALAPRHAHNDLIECLTEVGIAGLVALLLLAAAVVRQTRRQLRAADAPARVATAGAAGTLVALITAGLTGFPMEMPATMALAALSLGLVSSHPGVAADTPSLHAPSRPRVKGVLIGLGSILGVVAACALIVAVVVHARQEIVSSHALAVAERALRAEHGPAGAIAALPALARAEAATPLSFRVALRTAQAQVRLHHPVEGTAAAVTAIGREPFSPNAWTALAAVQFDGGDAVSARNTIGRSLELLHDYPFALYLNARAAEKLGDAATAEAAWARIATLARSPSPSTSPQLGITDSAREMMKLRTH